MTEAQRAYAAYVERFGAPGSRKARYHHLVWERSVARRMRQDWERTKRQQEIALDELVKRARELGIGR